MKTSKYRRLNDDLVLDELAGGITEENAGGVATMRG